MALFYFLEHLRMPLTNRVKSAVNTVVQNTSVPTMNQQATMTARGQLPNMSPHDGRPAGQGGPNVFLGMAQAVETATPVLGKAVSLAGSIGRGVVQGINTVGGTVAAISRGAAAISGISGTIGGFFSGKNSSKEAPVTAIQQISSSITGGVSKFSNPASAVASLSGSSFGTQLTSLELGGNATLIDILLSHGKKTDNAEMKYRIILRFEGNDKNNYDDVIFFGVYRFGFSKSCPMYATQINLPPVLIAQLKQEQASKATFNVNVKIYQVDTENKNKLKNLVFDRNFAGRVGADNNLTSPNIEKSNSAMVRLSMWNPTLLKMDLQYTFNKIENNKNPYEVLQDFESHITSTYGDNFVSKHILGKKNEHKYEQIVTQPTDHEVKLPNRKNFSFLCKHDADIPLFLNYKYKIDNAFSFYFFDDFDLKSEKEITRLFIALYDKNKFEKFKIGNQQDILKQTQLTNTYQFSDVHGLLTPGNSVGTQGLINGKFSTQKDQGGSSVQSNTQITGKGSVSGGDPGRSFNAQKTTETQHQIPTKVGQSSNQVPDTPDGNNERNEAANKVFNEKIQQIDSFVTRNCGFDFPRFSVLYPMNEKRPNEYLHTPIAISNVFKRDNDKEPVLSHSSKFLAVKFLPDSTSEGSSQSKSSNEGKNENRDASQAAVKAKVDPNNTPTKNKTPLNRGTAEKTPPTQPTQQKEPNPSPKPTETPKGPITNKPSETKQTRSFDRAYFREDGGGD